MKRGRATRIGMALTLALTALTAIADMSDAEREQLERLQRDVNILKQQVDRLLREKQQARTEAPAPPASRDLTLGTNPLLGNKEVRVVLVEFSDYQCPYCVRFHDKTFERLKRRYIDNGKLAYAYRDMPSASRRQAVKAAIAARCAGAQDRYHDMQALLFRNSTRLQNDSYIKYAKRLGLDTGKFEACLISDHNIDNIEKDLAEGRNLGIRGTPTFFIGRRQGNKVVDVQRLVGAMPYTVFKQAIDKALADSGS